MALLARLRARWYLVIVAAIVGVLVAGGTLYKVNSHGFKRKQHLFFVGSAQILVDSNPSMLTNSGSAKGGLSGRAALIADYATDQSVVRGIARRSKLPEKKLIVQAATAKANATGGSVGKAMKTGSGKNSVLFRATQQGPTIDITTQSKTLAHARVLAGAAVAALRSSIYRLHNSQLINRQQAAAAASTTTTTTSTTSTTTPAKTSKNKSAAVLAQARARAAARARQQAQQQAAARARTERSDETSRIILRQLGSVNTSQVLVSNSKTKAVGYAVVAFIVLVIIILLIDNLLVGRQRDPAMAAAPPAAAPREATQD